MSAQPSQLDTRYVDVQFTAIKETLSHISASLEKLADVSTGLAVTNERVMQVADKVDRSEESIDDMVTRISEIENVGVEANHQTRKELDKWINRGTGAWVVGVILVSVIQWIVMSQISSYNTHKENVDTQITAIDRRLTKIEEGQKNMPVASQPK